MRALKKGTAISEKMPQGSLGQAAEAGRGDGRVVLRGGAAGLPHDAGVQGNQDNQAKQANQGNPHKIVWFLLP